MKRIPLSAGRFALIDDEDLERVSQFKWTAKPTRQANRWYAHRTVRANGGFSTQTLHRFILDLHDPKVRVDHHDGNGLNNQKRNLRVCSNSQNMQNGKKKRDGKTSVFKGVIYNRASAKWQAQVYLQGKQIYLGLFATEIAAANAYNAAAIRLFGEFAKPNVIPEQKP